MFLGALSPSAKRMLLAGVGAVVLAACGSDVPLVTTPEPMSILAPADGSGSIAASAVRVSCDLVGPSAYSLTLSGSSSLSASGNETLQCRGSVTPSPPQNEFYSGFPCYLPLTADWTSNSSLTLHTNGGASMKCQAK